jgi:hypothetical protein
MKTTFGGFSLMPVLQQLALMQQEGLALLCDFWLPLHIQMWLISLT